MKRLLAPLLAAALLIHPPVTAGGPATSVRLTAYTASAAQTDSTPNLSACGRTRAGQVALSPDLKRRWPCGTWLRVYRPDTRRWHRYQVWDVTSARKRAQVDILMPSYQQAITFGVRYGKAAPQ